MTSPLQTAIITLPRPRIPAPTLSSVPPIHTAALHCDGELTGLVQVEPQGLVDLAVHELGARLVAVGWVISDPE